MSAYECNCRDCEGAGPVECYCESHGEECGCEHCHEHKEHNWADWNVRPIPCEYCALEKEMNDSGC